MTGQTILHFKVLDKLGGGGMGVVYKARDVGLERIVALKFLPPHLSTDESAQERFMQEARAASSLDHPNICTIYEIGRTDDGVTFIAMAYYAGRTLKRVLEDGPVNAEQAGRITRQIAAGLSRAHEAGIIHRDIKPANIMVTDRGIVKVLDFGLAKLAEGADLTREGSTLGTAAYMSPEQARGDEVDHRTDLWSLGVVAYEMLAGKKPFAGDYEQAAVYSILNEQPDELPDSVPIDLREVVQVLLTKDTASRIGSASEVEARLESYGGGSAVTSMSDAARISRTGNVLPSFLSKKGVLAVLVSVVAIAAVLFFFVRGGDGSEASSTASPESSGPSLAVMYFENQTPEENLERVLVDMLTTNLARYDNVNVMSSQRLFDILKQLGKKDIEFVDRSVATEVAEKGQIQTMVLGSIVQLGNQIRINAQLTDVKTGSILASVTESGESIEDVFTMVDRLTESISTQLELDTELAAVRISDVTTASLEAYKSYLSGREAESNWAWADAVEHYRKAIAEDSLFALAYGRLALSQGTLDYFGTGAWGSSELSRSSMAAAQRHANRATDLERRLVEVWRLGFWEGKFEIADSLARLLVSRYPNEKDVLETAAKAKTSVGDLATAASLYERAIELDPTAETVYNDLGYTYLRLGEYDLALSAIRKYRALKPDVWNTYDSEWEVLAQAGRQREAIATIREALSQNSEWYWLRRLMGVSLILEGRFEEALDAFQTYTAEADHLAIGPSGLRWTAQLLGYQGRYGAALEAMANYAQAFESDTSVAPALQSLGILQGFSGRLQEAYRTFDESTSLALRTGREPVASTNAYLAASLAIESRDLQTAEKYRSQLRQTLEDFDLVNFEGLLTILDAREDALASPGTFEPPGIPTTVFVFAMPPEVVSLTAESLRRRGEFDDAARMLESLRNNVLSGRYWFVAWDTFFHERSLLDYRLARIYEEAGDKAKAVEHYRVAREQWRNAEADFEPLKETVAALARLGVSD